jgi:hypothetical protein
LGKALKQVVLGDYNKDAPNLLGTLGSVALSFTGWDMPIDLANLKKSLDDWDGSLGQTGQVALAVVVLFPLVGIVKNADEVADLAKGAAKNLDELGGFAKAADFAPNNAKPLSEWLKDDPKLLDELRSQFKNKPQWQGIDPDSTPVFYRPTPEVKAIRAKPGESGGHHPHGLALGGPEGQKLTPTGEFGNYKNPLHTEATNMQRQLIKRIKGK